MLYVVPSAKKAVFNLLTPNTKMKKERLHFMFTAVRSLSVSFFIEKEPHKQLRMKRKRKGEREEKETPPAHGNSQ